MSDDLDREKAVGAQQLRRLLASLEADEKAMKLALQAMIENENFYPCDCPHRGTCLRCQAVASLEARLQDVESCGERKPVSANVIYVPDVSKNR